MIKIEVEKQMKKEKSCGAVIYKIEDEKIKFLVEKMNLGHTSIPKGHMETGETEEMTALREIKEETSLDVTLDTNFRHVVTYFPQPKVIKDVVFFIATPKNDIKPVDNHDDEVKESVWLDAEKAIQAVTHASDKETLNLALQYLAKNK